MAETEPATIDLSAQQIHDLFHTLFHANPIPTALTWLENGLLMDVNEAYLRYFGYERDEIIGRTPQELEQWLDPDERADLVSRVRAEGRIRDFEIDTGHPSGRGKTILLSLQHVTIEGEEALISAFIDVTERVRAERQIHTLAAQLTVAEQEERQRVSQILHDDLQQRLYAVHVQLSLLATALETDDRQSIQEEMANLEEQLAKTITLTRHLSIDLSPPVLKEDGLVQAISWLSAQMREQYGLEVQVQANNGLPDFDDHLRVLLFQVVREMLFNVVKHAGVGHALVQLEQSDHHLHISVSDDGQGFDAGARLATGYNTRGLSDIRQRLELLGCRMNVNSAPGKGTRLTIDIPLLNGTG